jgi:hypothetical protein
MNKKIRHVGDDEISPYLGLGNSSSTINSERVRKQNAQSKKRNKIRNNERFNSYYGVWAYGLVIAAIVLMGIVAINMELS